MMKPATDYLTKTKGRMVLRLVPAILVAVLWFSGYHTAAITLFVVVFIMVAYITLSPTTRLLGPVTTHLDGDGVLLTLDDGPHPDTTPAVLDVLDRHGAKAVFFVIGDHVKQWPHLAQEIVRRGHMIANHSQTHPSGTFWSLGPKRMWQEIATCQETLREVVGHTPTWFRAPVGHYNLFTHPALDLLGLRLLSWSCRGFDTVEKDVSRVLRRIEPDLKPGAIVLLHEAIPTSAELVEGVLVMIHEHGLKCAEPSVL